MKEAEILAAVLDGLPVALVALDENGRLLLWNHAAERITGHAREDLLREGWGRLLGHPKEDPATVLARCVRREGSRETWSIIDGEGHPREVRFETVEVEADGRPLRLGVGSEHTSPRHDLRGWIRAIVRTSLASYDDPDRAFGEILPLVADLIGIRVVFVTVREGEQGIALAIEDRVGLGLKPGAAQPYHKTFCSIVAQRRRSLVIANAAQDPQWSSHPDYLEYGFVSYVGAPILLGNGSLFGVLCGADIVPHDLDEEDAELLTIFAARIAREIDRAARHRKEQTLLDRLTLIFEEAPDLYISLDSAATIGEVNRRIADYGYRAEEVAGRLVFDLVQPDEIPSAIAAFEQAIQGREIRGLRLHLLRKDNDPVPVELNGRLVKTTDGTARILCCIRDLTLIERAMEALAESRSWTDVVYAQATDMAVLAAPDGRIVDVNEATCRQLGRTRESLVGQKVDTYVASEAGRRRARENFRRVLAGETNFVENQWVTASGRLLDVEITVARVRREGRDCLLAMARDVTEKRALARSLEELNRDLEDKVEERSRHIAAIRQELIRSDKMAAIGQLAAGIAHEIRNPLAVIKNVLYDLDRELADRPDLRDGIGMAREEMERIRSIIGGLLDFSRMDRGEAEEVEVNRIVELTLHLVQQDLALKGIEVVRHLGSCSNWPTNPDLLKQVLLNLIVNANQAMHHGGRLTVTTSATADRLTIRVEDTGEGIPEEDLPRIFEPFYTSRPPGQGTGLGLAIVHGAVTELGGTITVQSSVGSGTRFEISLPRPQDARS